MFGAVWAQAELRKVLAAMGGRVIEAELPVAKADGLIGADGEMHLGEEAVEHLHEILSELVAAAERELVAAGTTAVAGAARFREFDARA